MAPGHEARLTSEGDDRFPAKSPSASHRLFSRPRLLVCLALLLLLPIGFVVAGALRATDSARANAPASQQMAVIDHGDGWQTLYAHMSQVNVVCGQATFQGNVIGLVGSTGNSTGPHLHFEIESDLYGKVNPWDYVSP